jgi:hypothetical protein
VDPEFLLGSAQGGKGYGFALANASGNNVWCENQIAGVTDNVPGLRGVRMAKSSEIGEKMPAIV